MNTPKTVTDFPQVPLLLGRKTRAKNNILVGTDKAQIRFAEQLLGLECQLRDGIKDDDLLGKDESLLLRVTTSNCIDLSPDVKKKTGIWSINPLNGGSAGMNALVRAAAEILGQPVDKEKVEIVSTLICKDYDVTDVRGALWDSVWELSGEAPTKGSKWPQPWETQDWIPQDIDVTYRLNVLYRDLVGYVFAREDDLPAAKKFGINPSRFNRLRQMSLDLEKVEQSIKCLSKWRTRKSSSLISALVISKIWNRQY
jgi:hypothetical protein